MTGQTFWTEGDLCIYESPQSEEHILGFIKKVDPVTKFCKIYSPLVKTECHVNAEELYCPTVKQKDGIVQSPLNKSTVLLADAQFFSRKLNKIIGLTTEVVPKSSTKCCVKTENKSRTWSVGDLCICMWSEDGNYYYASITQTDPRRDQYLVTFCYYENQEMKTGDELHELGTDFELLVEDDQNKAAVLSHKVNQSRKSINVPVEEVEQAEKKLTSLLNNFKVKKADTDHRLPRAETTTEHVKRSQQQKQQQQQRRLPEAAAAAAAVAAASAGSKMSTAPDTDNFTTDSPPTSYMCGDNFQATAQNTAAISSLSALTGVNQNMSGSAWQALLISWFMCGYHTGFYEALQNHQKK